VSDEFLERFAELVRQDEREQAEKQEHKPWCDYLNIMLTSLPPQKAKCNCKQAEKDDMYKNPDTGNPCEGWDTSDMAHRPNGLTTDDDDIQEYKKPWVGLTDEEIDYIWGISPGDYEDKFAFPRAIEAKLREKNT
jgi:hypothetical protein